MDPLSSLTTQHLKGIVFSQTPLVQKGLELAQRVSSKDVFNHVIRSFLLGYMIADRSPHLRGRDREVHALATILHDLGLPMDRDPSDSRLSTTKRFEVDAADKARDFIIKEGTASEWSESRLQLVWDAIALHSTASIALYKEPEVRACCLGIRADFLGPEQVGGGVLSWADFDQCVQHFPRLSIAEGFKTNMLSLCLSKPATTFDNMVGEWGKKYLTEQDYPPPFGQVLLERSMVGLDARGECHDETPTDHASSATM